MALHARIATLGREGGMDVLPVRWVRHLHTVTLFAPRLHIVTFLAALARKNIGIEVHDRLIKPRSYLFDLAVALRALVRSGVALMTLKAGHHHRCGCVEVA